MKNKRKNCEILNQRVAYFRTDLKWLAHKIWMLERNFNLGRKYVRCFTAVQNFKKFA